MAGSLKASWGEFGLPEPVRALRRTRLDMQRSLFASRKCGRVWNLESSIELDYAHFLEWSPEVLQYVPQPMEIQILQSGFWKKYVPDFLHIDTGHRRVITEIKPAGWDESPFLMEKYLACGDSFRRKHYVFKVVTDKQIRNAYLHTNLRFLYSHFKSMPPSHSVAVSRALIQMNGRARVSELLERYPLISFSACAAYAYESWLDIHTEPFTVNSILTVEL